MKTKRSTKNYNDVITHHYLSVKMVLLVKLAVISEIEGGASLLKIPLAFHHLFYIF